MIQITLHLEHRHSRRSQTSVPSSFLLTYRPRWNDVKTSPVWALQGPGNEMLATMQSRLLFRLPGTQWSQVSGGQWSYAVPLHIVHQTLHVQVSNVLGHPIRPYEPDLQISLVQFQIDPDPNLVSLPGPSLDLLCPLDGCRIFWVSLLWASLSGSWQTNEKISTRNIDFIRLIGWNCTEGIPAFEEIVFKSLELINGS